MMPSIDSMSRDRLLELLRGQLETATVDMLQHDGTHVFVSGPPDEVVVRVTRQRLIVALYRVVWDGPHTPLVDPRPLATLNWPAFSESALTQIVRHLIDSAKRLRRDSYRTCQQCETRTPPEHMHDDQICQGCAPGVLGVVY